METLISLYRSSVGKKVLMGLTGSCLCGFLIFHLGGNLLLFKNDGGRAFDAYADVLPSLYFIRIIELILFAIILFHIFMGTLLWFRNRSMRPEAYDENKPGENSSLTSRTMFFTGSIVFIFLTIHMRSIWFISRYKAGEGFSMYELVRASFASPIYSLFYVSAMVVLAFHLHHGFQSAMQTFGLRNKKYDKLVDLAGMFFWFLIPLFFALMPIYFLLNLNS